MFICEGNNNKSLNLQVVLLWLELKGCSNYTVADLSMKVNTWRIFPLRGIPCVTEGGLESLCVRRNASIKWPQTPAIMLLAIPCNWYFASYKKASMLSVLDIDSFRVTHP